MNSPNLAPPPRHSDPGGEKPVSLMETWMMIYSAYLRAGHPKILWRIAKSHPIYAILNVLFVATTFVLYLDWLLAHSLLPFLDQHLVVLAATTGLIVLFVFGLALTLIERGTFKAYYGQYRVELKRRERTREFLRYLLFRDDFRKETESRGIQITTELLDKIITLHLAHEIDLASGSLFSKHPLTLALVSLATAIAGGIASARTWPIARIVSVGAVLGFALWINYVWLGIGRTNEYQLRELKAFLVRLKSEMLNVASERRK